MRNRQTGGHNGAVGSTAGSHLQIQPEDEVQDLVCVGFGPASLAIAVALHESIESQDGGLSKTDTKVRFLERQHQFAWHAGMLIPDARMQIAFMKDMATLRNPRSKFTFLNYLHQQRRLVAFTNEGSFLPQRIEYEDYMRWCAKHFDDVVQYNQNVTSVDVSKLNPTTGEVEQFSVTSTDIATGSQTICYTRHVVIAAGGRPNIPKPFQIGHPRIIHSSQYMTNIDRIFIPGQSPRSIAVIGGGQSAAECFRDVASRFSTAKVNLIIRGVALNPSDDSPFVNEVFHPSRVNDVYNQSPAVRAESIARDKATNYGVVRVELLQDLYSKLYSQRVRYGKEEDWPLRILSHRTVVGTESISEFGKSTVRLHVRNKARMYTGCELPSDESLDVDLVILASGYRRDTHEELLSGISHLMPGGNGKDASGWTVGRDYGVQFKANTVSADAGVWLQGCNEKTHGLSDSLLSILAIRGGEMVQSIFGRSKPAVRRQSTSEDRRQVQVEV